MNPGRGTLCVFFALFMGVFLIAFESHAAKPIAKVSSFKGKVIVLSGTKFKDIEVGLALMHGDRIQTKDGRAEITFNDGALLKVRPYASTMIQEREVEKGWWVFKTKKSVRRITCFVGSLWFKSGVSKRKNYIQTPTAVCGLRGTELDVLYDNLMMYIAPGADTSAADFVATGVAKTVQELLFDPGAAAKFAGDSNNYVALDNASASPEDKKLALKATVLALTALINNPNIDPAEKAALEEARENALKDLNALLGPDEQITTEEKIEALKQDIGTPAWLNYLQEGSPSGNEPPPKGGGGEPPPE